MKTVTVALWVGTCIATMNCGARSPKTPSEAVAHHPVPLPRFKSGTDANCPIEQCAAGQLCRRRSLVQPIGEVTFAKEGVCPPPSSSAECHNAPGRICCVTEMTLLDFSDQKCVDVPRGCADCDCMPKNVCGDPEETVQVCTQVRTNEVMCDIPPKPSPK